MKKLLIALFILGSGRAYAALDRESSMRPSMWRSSSTCVTVNMVLLSTGNIHIHSISVDSATLNNAGTSEIDLFNSTSVPNSGQNAANFSTGTRVATNISGSSNMWLPPSDFDQFYSSGVVVNRQGGACTTILWDYVLPEVNYLVPWRP